MMKMYQALYDKNLYISLYVGDIEHRIGFTGADANNNGVYHTDDPKIQHMLESSDMYNRLYKLKTVLIPKQKSPLVGPGIAIEGTIVSQDYKDNNLMSGQNSPRPYAPVLSDDSANLTPKLEATFTETQAKEVVIGSTSEQDGIAFRNLTEAQDYFGKEPYNIPKYKLRSSASIISLAETLNVSVKFER